MNKTRLTWAKDKRRLGRNKDLKKEFTNQAQNRYYWTIRKTKRECWQKFLQEKFQSQSPGAAIDKNYC